MAPAPVVLLVGTEQSLADVAVRRLTAQVLQAHPDLERHILSPGSFVPGSVLSAGAASLFGGYRLLVLSGLEAASGPYSAEVTTLAEQLAAAPDPDLVVLGRHGGGNGGKKVLAALAAVPGAVRVACTPVTGDRARAELVTGYLRQLGQRVEPDAVAELVAAVGGEVAELLAIASQLAETNETPTVTAEQVRALTAGRREAGGFDIADAAVAGDTGRALALVRHAVAQRVEPVLVVGALAAKLRAMARVAGAGRGPVASVARELGMPPWQVERARRELRGWRPEGLRQAVVATADADAAVKGELAGVAAAYALERVVVQVGEARGR